MFVLVHNNHVESGPCNWSKGRFETVLLEDLEIDHKLPVTYSETSGIYVIDDNTKIYPVRKGDDIPHNPRIEVHNGPFWQFTDTEAVYHYEPVRMSLDVAKTFLINEVGVERYKKEVSGTKVTLQGKEVSVNTDRGTREIYTQRYTIMEDGEQIQWKFAEGWLTISKAELGDIVRAKVNHIQSAFDWEANLIEQINNCNTHEELLDIVVIEKTEEQGIQ